VGVNYSKQNPIVKGDKRREKSNFKIKSLGIVCMEQLPILEEISDVTLKSLDEICKRAVACMLSIQLACDIVQDNSYEESREFFLKLLKKYGVEKDMLPSESTLFRGNYSKQDAINVAWTYETYWSLVWALGLIDDIEIPNTLCDCEKAIRLVCDCESYDVFKAQCKLRDIEDILDMLELYYRYHWACVEKSIRPETTIGDLNPEVVVERRRGLEWLISDENVWNDISLDT
jgi:hypothetical protein